MEIKFTKMISRWRLPSYHKRNIEIALQYAKGESQKKIAKDYNLSSNRINQIVRIAFGMLAAQLYRLDWTNTIFDKKYYNHPDKLLWIIEYKKFYENLSTNIKLMRM